MPSALSVSDQYGKEIANSSEMTLHSRCPAWIVTERVENIIPQVLSFPPLKAAAGKAPVLGKNSPGDGGDSALWKEPSGGRGELSILQLLQTLGQLGQ